MLKKQVLKRLGQPHLPGSSPWAYSSVKDSDAVACGAETPIYDMRGPIHRSEGHRAEESRPDPAEGVMCEETVLHEEGHGLWQGRPVIENHSATMSSSRFSHSQSLSLSHTRICEKLSPGLAAWPSALERRGRSRCPSPPSRRACEDGKQNRR